MTAYVQVAVGGEGIPVQTGARALLLALVFLAMVTSSGAGTEAGPLTIPLSLFAFTAGLAFLASLVSAPSSAEAAASFLFVYGTGLLLVVFVLAPVVVRPGPAFSLLCVAALTFGLVQVVKQDLLLPETYREKFGIVYVEFVNDNVRAVSFFASAPRFAELLVLMASYLQFGFLTGERRGPIRIMVYLVTLYVLYSTYSRSGYVLFVATLLVQLLLMRSRLVGESQRHGGARLAAALFGLAAGLVALSLGRIPFDRSVIDTASFAARQAHWGDVFKNIDDQNILELILGTGTSAHFTVLSPEYFVVDNLALAIFLYSGILGLFSFVWLCFAVLREGLTMSHQAGYARWHPLLAFCTSLLVEGVFVDNHNTVFITLFAMMGMLSWDRIRLKGSAPGDLRVGAANPMTRSG